MSSLTRLLLFTLSSLLIAGSTMAQLVPRSLDARVAESNLIIEGKVISKQSSWDVTNTNICTINTILVSRVFKGIAMEDHVQVITRGGVVGLVKEEVTHCLQLEVGEYGLFTLQPSYLSVTGFPLTYRASSGVQGLLRYESEAQGAYGAFEEYSSVETGLRPMMESIVGQPSELRSQISWRSDEASSPQLSGAMMSIISFSPTTCPAGTPETIIIQGTGFGSAVGTVRFSNADDGGATFIDGLSSAIVSWSDTEIEVKVDESAGTGPIQVVGPTTFTSDTDLFVPYAQTNATFDSGEGDVDYQTHHVDDNGQGGYTWRMFEDFADNTAAADAFSRAMSRWVQSTCVNWTIGEDTETDVISNDGINVVRFDNGNELTAGKLGVCTSRFSGCFIGDGIEWYITELDIVFDDDTDWNFDTSAPGFSQYDFESVAVHELGHGHQLGHVIDSNKVMHFSLSNGEDNREIATSELEGATDVMNRSKIEGECGPAAMTDSDECCDAPELPLITASETTVCPDGTSTLTITGALNSATAWHIYSTSCGETSVGSTTSTFDVNPSSTTTYFVRGEDGDGCVDESAAPCGSITISTEDSTAPVVTCPGNRIETFDQNCQFTMPDYTGLVTVTDDCATGLAVSQDPPQGMIFNSSNVPISVTMTSTDLNGNEGMCSFDVLVLDETAPIISTCPSDHTVAGEADCTATLNDYISEIIVTDDCDGAPSISQTPIAGTSFSGTIGVTITATDAVGNQSECIFTVTVEDLTAPSLTCLTDMDAPLDDACEYTVPDFTGMITVDDNCDPSPILTQFPPAGTTLFGTGTQSIVITAEDAAGNQDQCSFELTMIDDTPPLLECPSDETILGDATCGSTLADYTSMVTATDNCASIITVFQSPVAGTEFSESLLVTITATDDVGNVSDCTFTVTVQADATFSYDQTNYCANGDEATPTITGANGGTFSSAPTGLNIQSTTGTFDPLLSVAGEYTVTYTVGSDGCNGTHQEQVTILPISNTECGGIGVANECSEAIAVPTLLHGSSTFTSAPLASGPSVTGCAGDADDAIWFSFIAGSSQDVLFARDPLSIYDAAIEVYESCGTSLVACGNNYSAGQIERYMPGGLTPGEEYLVRVYNVATGIASSTTVEFMVNTFADSELQSSYCGVTDYVLTDVIMSERDDLGQLYDEPAVPVKGYAFRVMEGETVIGTRYIDAVNGFYTPLYAIGALAYDTEYEVSVAHSVRMQVNGGISTFWSEFGTPCTIALESTFPTTQLKDQFCNVSETFDLGTNVQCQSISGADRYQFVFVDGSNVFSKTSTNYSLKLYQVPGLTLGTTYSVSIRARIAGEWTPYGSSCELTLDALPNELQLKSQFCDQTYSLQQSNASVSCQRLSGADEYEFKLASTSLTEDEIVSSSNHVLFFRDVPFLENGNEYEVSVRARIGEVWGEFGESCSIFIGELMGQASESNGMAGLTKSLKKGNGKFELMIYPNPNNGHQFRIRLIDIIGSGVVKVDLVNLNGRIIETRKLSYNERTEILWTSASRLEQGMYLIRVTDRLGNSQTELMMVE